MSLAFPNPYPTPRLYSLDDPYLDLEMVAKQPSENPRTNFLLLEHALDCWGEKGGESACGGPTYQHNRKTRYSVFSNTLKPLAACWRHA